MIYIIHKVILKRNYKFSIVVKYIHNTRAHTHTHTHTHIHTHTHTHIYILRVNV